MSLTSANYNVTGNPSITSNFILTPTDENSYVTSSVATPTNSEFDIYTKVTAIDLQGVVGTGIMSILMSSNPTTSVSVLTQFRYPGIFTAISNIEGVQDSTSTYGPSISANTDYWIRLHVSSPATHKLTLYAIADNNYTRDTLPNTGWYVSQDIDVSSSIYAGHNVRIGWGTLVSEINPASISIDLKETFISVQGNVVWEAVQTISPLNNKGYTNYTIIGDPTYNDGVYSDFRHDRYLQFPQDLKGTDKTYIVKFTTGSTVEGRQFIVNNYKFFTLCLDENYVCLFDWADSLVVNHLFAPAVNTTYYVKAAYNGLTVTVSHSMDGTSWVQDLQYTYSELVTSKDQYGFSVGNHPVWTTSPFRGSIDLNDFYVLDTATQKVLWMPSTKIKSVVHGIVYGNPTISDKGILSNISTTNYLKVSTPVAQDYNTLEIGLKVITSSMTSITQFMWTDNAGFRINGATCQLGYYDPDTSTSTPITVLRWNALSNTEYWLKLTHDGTTYEFSYSTDGVNYTTLSYESSTKLTINQLFTFGSTLSTSANQSSLDLSKMYIKVNGQEVWKAWHSEADYQGGSIDISKGFYSNGINEIMMSPTNFGINSLKSGQIVGNQNKVYVASTNNVNSLHLVGNDATEQTLKGTYDVYAALNQPVYLSHAENYLASGDAGDISQAEFSYTSGRTTANYTVVGSPTIDENFVVSNFSPSNYVTTTTPTVTSTFDMIARHILPASASKNGTYPDSLSFSGADIGFGLNVTGSKFTPVLYFTSSSSTTATQYANTTLWTWLKMTTTTCELYVLEDSTNQYTLDTLPAIGSWTRKCYYSDSTNRLSYVSGKTLHFGINNANSNASANWTIDLKNSKYVADGVEWRGITTSPASVTIPKTFWYDSTSHNSYWYPQSVTVALADAKAEQTVGDVNSIFVTNELGQDVSGITFTNGTVQGNYVSSAKAPGQNVYLDHKTHTNILGVQGEPDEIVIEGGLWTQPVLSSNGTWGGAAFAVSASSILSSDSEPWKAFDGIPDTNSNDRWHSSSGHPAWIGWYNPEPLIITNIQVQNRAVDGSFINSYDVSYSDDGSTWTVCTSGTSPDQTNGAYWNIPISETIGHKYWKLISNSSSGRNSDYTAVGLITLTAHTDILTVSIGTTDNWTALQNRTYWYEDGNTTDVSDLTSDTYEADLKGYIIFSEDANEDLIVKGYTSAYTVTTYNTPDVYSGYSYTVTDSTGASISTFEKTGTLCKAYTIPAMAGLKFVFIPAEDLEDGHVYEAGDIREAYSETNGTPFRQLDESTEDYTYNASTDTLTDENEGELTCIGHVYVEWNDIAE